MRNKINGLSILLLGGLALGACKKDPVAPEMTAKNVAFTASMNAQSRATDTSFDNGDAISVFATEGTSLSSSNYADNVKYSYSTATSMFTATSPITVEEGATLKYFAVYPYSAEAGRSYTFNVQSDQTGTGYTRSDLCYAVSSLTDDEMVHLKFNHALTKVVFNLIGEGWSSNVSIVINDVYTRCSVNLNDQTFKYGGSSDGDVKMVQDGNKAFKAILPSQVLKAGVSSVTVTMDGKSYTYTIDSDITLTAGKQIELSLNPPVPGPNPDKNVISFGGDINDWDDEPEPPINKLFEEPYIKWGASQSTVKNHMSSKGYSLYESESTMIVYEGKYSEELIMYSFDSGKLVQASLAFDDTNVKFSQLNSVLKNDYELVSEDGESVLYATADFLTAIMLSSSVLDNGVIAHYIYYIDMNQILGETRGFSEEEWIECVKNLPKPEIKF